MYYLIQQHYIPFHKYKRKSFQFFSLAKINQKFCIHSFSTTKKKVDNRNNLIQAGIPRKLVSKAVWIHKVTLAIGTFTLDWDFFLLLLSTFSKLQS